MPGDAISGSRTPPGTFLERLNFPEFISLIDVLAEKVQKIIIVRGLPSVFLGSTHHRPAVLQVLIMEVRETPPKQQAVVYFSNDSLISWRWM